MENDPRAVTSEDYQNRFVESEVFIGGRNRQRMKDPKWHQPNPVHAELAKMAEADREIRPADPR
jgi:hypothetical protein